MKRIAHKYGFKVFSADLIAAANDSPYRQSMPKTILFFAENIDHDLIAFLSFWQGGWHPIDNPNKYKLYFHVTHPELTKKQITQFTQELTFLAGTNKKSLKPQDFISKEDWQEIP
ncbi:hypothetical protein [Levilactobacillus fujinensis]|nr:hypothetical protein [Levilactobacillus fujinensis]